MASPNVLASLAARRALSGAPYRLPASTLHQRGSERPHASKQHHPPRHLEGVWISRPYATGHKSLATPRALPLATHLGGLNGAARGARRGGGVCSSGQHSKYREGSGVGSGALVAEPNFRILQEKGDRRESRPMHTFSWILSRRAISFLKGASAATFASTAVVAACAQAEPEIGVEGAMVSIPRVKGKPQSAVAPHSTMSAVGSNSFYEDRSVVHSTTSPSGEPEHYFAVLDGHGGWDCAEFAYSLLPVSISESLAASKQPPTESEVEAAICQGFLKVEETWTNNLKKEWLREPNYVTYGPPGTERLSSVGTCVLLACVHRGVLYVANAGDSRAVIAQKGFGGSYRAQRVTSDLNAMNPSEQERLKRDHPGEPDIFRCRGPYSCYVKGCLQPTYSIGDAYLKYPYFNNFPGRVIAEPYCPPYIRTVPQITARPLTSCSEGDFLILATDGVWDYLSDQNAVDLVCRAQRTGTNPAEAVVDATLKLAASRFGIKYEELVGMPCGRQRRRIHDDATVVVVDLNSAAAVTARARSKL